MEVNDEMEFNLTYFYINGDQETLVVSSKSDVEFLEYYVIPFSVLGEMPRWVNITKDKDTDYEVEMFINSNNVVKIEYNVI